MKSDILLLERWWVRRDGEAFNEIVTRYSGLVYGACLRVLGNPSDAEDVAQECFLRLAERPVEIRSSLGGLLHRMATRRALDAYRSRVRRLSRDTRFAESTPEASAPDDLTWYEIRALVDEAIDSLPEELRDIIVAHFIERRTQQAIAADLGVARRTVINRIQKGIELVRAVLSNRGVVTGETALLALFGSRLAEAAPASLLSELGRLALAGTAGKATTATSVAGVAGGIVVMKKTVIGAAVLASVLLAGLYLASGTRTAPQDAEDAGPAPSSSAREDRQGTTPALNTTELAGAMETALGNARTDREAIDAPSEDAVVEGVVRNQQGVPVAGATIHIASKPTQDDVLGKPPLAQTGTDGRFRVGGVNPDVHTVFADHPDYASGWSGMNPREGETVHAEILLTRGGAIEGIVTSGGAPQPDAFVSAWLDASALSARTDAEGRYSLPRVPTGEWIVGLMMQGDGGVQREARQSVVVSDNAIATVDFNLPAPVTDLGGAVSLRGTPVEGGYVSLLIDTGQGSREERRVGLDDRGNYRFPQVPEGRAVLSITAIASPRQPYFRCVHVVVDGTAPNECNVDIQPGTGAIQGALQLDEPARNGAVLLLDGEFNPPELSRETMLYIDSYKVGISQEPGDPYRFGDLEPGTYTLLALVYPDESSLTNTVDPLATALVDLRTVDLADGEQLDVDLEPKSVP